MHAEARTAAGLDEAAPSNAGFTAPREGRAGTTGSVAALCERGLFFPST